MKFPPHKALIAFLFCSPSLHAAVIDVIPGSHNAPILSITYSVNGSDVVQNTEATDVVSNSDTPVYVKSVSISDGSPVVLSHFNTEGAVVVNVNSQQLTISGIGVFNNGAVTTSNAGLAAYADAVAGTSMDTDLKNFTFHDLLSNTVSGQGADYDLLFYRGLQLDDYFMVSERWGNSEFEVTALDQNGNPYANANVLRIGANGGVIYTPDGYQVYDWVTGYAASTNVATQSQAITLFSVQKFFESTIGPSGPVFGLRINNDFEADFKIVGISANSFSDNPLNPVVPETSACLFALAGTGLLLRRRR